MATKAIQRAIDDAPAGTSGLVIEPWTGDVYGVAANWAGASSPVLAYGENGWHSTQYQVADFGHDPYAALREQVEQAVIASGDDPEEDETDISDATSF